MDASVAIWFNMRKPDKRHLMADPSIMGDELEAACAGAAALPAAPAAAAPTKRKPDKRVRVRKGRGDREAEIEKAAKERVYQLQIQSRAILDDYNATLQKQLRTQQNKIDVLIQKVNHANWLRRAAVRRHAALTNLI
jgi:phenylpyruvate tautomerase PptA (4-oxalocrotonate tautomerase family)